MNKLSWLFHPLFYCLVLFYIILGYLTLGFDIQWMPFLYREDGYFEYAGAVSLFIASIVLFYTFWKALKTRADTGMHWIKLTVYLGMALLFFFGAGEEISWGQRIFNIETPEVLMEVNAQEEISVHNLIIFTDIGVEDLFNLFWMVVIVLIPFMTVVWRKFRVWAEKFIPIVYWSVGALFLFNYLLAKLVKIVYVSIYSYSRVPFVQAVQEIKESHYSFLLIFFSVFLLWSLNQTINNSSKKEI